MTWATVFMILEKFGAMALGVVVLGVVVVFLYKRLETVQKYHLEQIRKAHDDYIASLQDRVAEAEDQLKKTTDYAKVLRDQTLSLSKQVDVCRTCKEQAEDKAVESQRETIDRMGEFYGDMRKEFDRVWDDIATSNKEVTRAVLDVVSVMKDLSSKNDIIAERLSFLCDRRNR